MPINLKKTSELTAAIALFLVPFYFFRFSYGFIKTNILELAVFLTIFSTFYFLLSTKQKIRRGPMLPYVFLLIAFISIFVSGDCSRALGIFKGWFLVPVLVYWLVINLFNGRNAYKLIWPVFISALIISLWAILQKLGLIGTLFYQSGDPSFSNYLSEGRYFGPFESPNYLAMFIVPTLAVSLFLLPVLKRKTARVLFIISLFVPLTALILTASKGGLIAIFSAAAVGSCWLALTKAKPLHQKIIIILLFLVLTLAGLILAFKRVDLSTGGNSVRKEIYGYSIQMLRQKPLMGIGLGNFQKTIDQYSKNNPSFQRWGMPYALHPHNLFLALWLNLGILGIVSFLLIICLFIRNISRASSIYGSLLVSAMTAILAHGLFDTTYFKNDLSVIFWLIFGLSVIYSKTNENTLKN